MSNAITIKNFKAKLSAFKTSAKTQRDNLQQLIMFAIDHAANHQDEFTCLSQVLNATIEVKAFRTETIKDYIKAHVTNIQYTKLGDGSMGFSKLKKGVPCEYSVPEMPWYNFNTKGEAKADVHPLVLLKSWMTKAEKAIREGKVQDESEREQTMEAIKHLKTMLA